MQSEATDLISAISLEMEQRYRHPVSYTHLTLPTKA